MEQPVEIQQTFNTANTRTTHECFVCGDTIELTAQVCSRFCMRTLEQLDCMDSLEAQLEIPCHSDYQTPHNTPLKIVPVPQSPVLEPLFLDNSLQTSCLWK